MDSGVQRVPLVPVADPLEVPDELPLVLVPVPVPVRDESVGVTAPEPETEPDPDPVPLPAAVQPASPHAMATARAVMDAIVFMLFSSSGAQSPRSADMNPAVGGRPSICNRRSHAMANGRERCDGYGSVGVAGGNVAGRVRHTNACKLCQRTW